MKIRITTLASTLAVLAFSPTSFAAVSAVSAECGKVCQNAIDVFKTPTSYNAQIGDNKGTGGGSIVYVTWTSKTDLALAPAKFAGTTDVKLHSTKLQGVSLPDPNDGCVVTLVLAEHGAKGTKTYRVPARNVLCDAHTN